MTTEYELSYEFLAPQETKREETYIVNLMLEDVSGNKVTKALTLYLDGDFKAPQFLMYNLLTVLYKFWMGQMS